MLQYAARGAQRTGELDRTEVGLSDDNRDVVAGRDQVEVDGMLDEHTGHGLVVVADEVETNVGGPLTMHAHLEENIIMAGVMTVSPVDQDWLASFNSKILVPEVSLIRSVRVPSVNSR